MTVYAVPTKSCDYATKGRSYKVLREVAPRGFYTINDEGDDIFCIWANCDHIHGGDWERVEDDERITLKIGDYVSTEGMTQEQYHAVARAFANAGCPRFDPSAGMGTGRYLEWWDDKLVSTSSIINGGRHLTIDQVLSATNATETTMTTDPITTLKQARTARDEAEQAYQKALAEAREYLGEGFMLAEVGVDWAAPDEDMTDPANWRE